MDKTGWNVADFVVDGLQTRQQLVDTKRTERVAALEGADMQVQNVSLWEGMKINRVQLLRQF